jgi:hypothetical protein
LNRHRFIQTVFGPSDCFPLDRQRGPHHSVTVGGLPHRLVPCPRCYRPLVQVALLPPSLTVHFGGREAWPILLCPHEDNFQVLSYTIKDQDIRIVDFLHGTADGLEIPVEFYIGQAEESVLLTEVLPRDEARFAHLAERFALTHSQDELHDLDGLVTQAWENEYCENANLIELTEWPEMLFGSLPPGMLRVMPGPCPITGNVMTAVGVIGHRVGKLEWSDLPWNTAQIAYCEESACITVTVGVSPDFVWIQ